MNKKFKYKKSLLAAILSATLLAGCDGGGSGSSSDTPPVDSGTGSLPEVKPDPTPNPEPTPEPTPDPEPTPEPIPDPEPTPEPEPEPVPTKTGYLTLVNHPKIFALMIRNSYGNMENQGPSWFHVGRSDQPDQ